MTMKLFSLKRGRNRNVFWTAPAAVVIGALGALLAGLGGELLITVVEEENTWDFAKLFWLRTVVVVCLIALLAAFVGWQRSRTRDVGTFYYLEMREAGESRRGFIGPRAAAERAALASRSLEYFLPFQWGSLDARDQVETMIREWNAVLNADDEATSFNIGCDVAEPIALTLGYSVTFRANTRLLELSSGPEKASYVVCYAMPTEILELSPGRFRIVDLTPIDEDELSFVPTADGGESAIEKVLVTVRARAWEQARKSAVDCFATARKLPNGEFFDRCVAVSLGDDEGRLLPYEFPVAAQAPRELRHWDPTFRRVDAALFQADAIGVVSALAEIYKRYPRAVIYLDLRMEKTLALAVGDVLRRHPATQDGIRDFWTRTVFLRRMRSWMDGAIWTHPALPDPDPYFTAWRGDEFWDDAKRNKVWKPDCQHRTESDV